MNSNPPRILIVDDSSSVAESLKAYLSTRDYSVDSASSGYEALRLIRKHNYDIVVCDIEMPEVSGLDILETMRNEGISKNVILMTGYQERDYYIRAIQLGASDFITKPVEAEQLLKSVQSIMDKDGRLFGKDDLLNNLDDVHFNCVINPLRYGGYSITAVMGPFFYKHINLPQDKMNSIILCADEMLNNAFIHGVLGLTSVQRHSQSGELRDLIAAKLQQPHIASRRIRFELHINNSEECIHVTVEDDGDGFDHESWLQRLAEEKDTNLEGSGRGLRMLLHLSDNLHFANGGRKVRVTHYYNSHQHSVE